MADTVIETINIEEITEHASKKGTKFWKAKTADGDFYTVWKQDVMSRLAQGVNTVSIDVNDTGDKVFKNIVGIAPSPDVNGAGYLAEMGAAPPPKAAPARPQAAVPMQNSQQASPLTSLQMARAYALQAAAHMVATGVIPTVEMVPMSERNVNYILNGAGESKTNSVPADEYVER